MNIVPAPVPTTMENLTEEANTLQSLVQGNRSPENAPGVPPVLGGNNTALAVQSNPVSGFQAAQEPEPQRAQTEGENLNEVSAQGSPEDQPHPGLGGVASPPAAGVQGRVEVGSHPGVGGAASPPATVPRDENAPRGGASEGHSGQEGDGSQGGVEGGAPSPPVTRNQVHGFAPFEVVNWLQTVGYFRDFRTAEDQEGLGFRNTFASQGIAGPVLLDINMQQMRAHYGLNPGQAHQLLRIVRDIPTEQGMIYFFPLLP